MKTKLWQCKDDPLAIMIEVPYDKNTTDIVVKQLITMYSGTTWKYHGRARVGNSLFVKFAKKI